MSSPAASVHYLITPSPFSLMYLIVLCCYFPTVPHCYLHPDLTQSRFFLPLSDIFTHVRTLPYPCLSSLSYFSLPPLMSSSFSLTCPLPPPLPLFISPCSLYHLTFTYHIRVLVHVVRGDSEDPVGDFIAINQELELFNPKLALKTQVTEMHPCIASDQYALFLHVCACG